MSVHADPRPLETPVSGGETGATVTVEPIVTGRFRSPAILHSSPGGEVGKIKTLRSVGLENPAVPIPAFLIRHPKAGPILVDTGLHPSIASDPTENQCDSTATPSWPVCASRATIEYVFTGRSGRSAAIRSYLAASR